MTIFLIGLVIFFHFLAFLLMLWYNVAHKEDIDYNLVYLPMDFLAAYPIIIIVVLVPIIISDLQQR